MMAGKIPDCRVGFMSFENRNLLEFTYNYASNYTKGANDENCDMCHRFFHDLPRWMYCLVDKTNTERFLFVCVDCWKISVRDESKRYKSFELYPRVRLSDVWTLCRFGVFKKFHFKIDPGRCSARTVRITDTKRDVMKFFDETLRKKHDHEQILSIELQTYGGVVFAERFEDAVMERNLIRITPNGSRLSQVIESGFKFENKTYIYEIKMLVHHDPQTYQIFVDRECGYYCKKCTIKKQYRGNPIMFCSRCGNTDSKYNQQFVMDNIEYDKKRLKWKIGKRYTLLYYDISDCIDKVLMPDYVISK
ncbi:ME53 [Spodoptera littoralis nucleopolyhedrovirus]|uniref:ME53 n=1 Tax=Spodoptera littoralis nuclear polyhedrosis virus TaxID=10456 RepID=M1JNQ4_NPVSL|nr:ME53 [Spodoptera littoralis nucleopolyhedrovirus]AGE89878.1 ME53 [Spodoptera littoralis nucleopolyhedrovirus]